MDTIEKKHYIRNNVIFREGDEADCMYEVNSGCVGIYANYGTPGAKLLAELKDGQYFGEMAMIDGLARSATAVALSDRVSLHVITWQTLGEFFRERPSTVVMIMQQMGRRVRGMNEDYMDACNGILEIVEKAEAEGRRDEALWIRKQMRRHLERSRSGR